MFVCLFVCLFVCFEPERLEVIKLTSKNIQPYYTTFRIVYSTANNIKQKVVAS